MTLAKTIRRKLARRAMRLRVSLWGNNHSGMLNLRYWLYHRKAQHAFHPPKESASAEALAALDRFKRDGFVVLPTRLDTEAGQALKHKVDGLYDSGVDVFKVSSGLYRLIDGAERIPEIVNLLNGPISEVLERYYGSHYKLYNISFYRTIPDDSVPESSFLWHFDNSPDQEIKLMIYLDEVSDETGAFRFKNLATSEKARSLGFWHREDYSRTKDMFDDAGTTIVGEGAPGTAILFRQGRVAHKATAPRHSHRDVVTMMIIPSLIPWREHFARNKHLLSTNAGLCKNPWTDEPEAIGYRF